MTNEQTAFFLARCTLGLNFLVHGLVRFPKLKAFVDGMTKGFEKTWLPDLLVQGFSYVLPFLEFGIGVLLILGLKTKQTLTVTFVLMGILIFGSGLKEDWNAVSGQMVYVVFLFLLILNLKHNALAMDDKQKTRINGFRTQR